MIQWFYRWLGDKISDANQTDDGAIPTLNSGRTKSRRIQAVRESDELHSEPIHFRMFKANGGWAIEFRQYDNKQDRHETSLYVVNGEEELGHHISQIITMEALKR